MFKGMASHLKLTILLWTLLINSLFIYFILQQVTLTERLNHTWHTQTLNNVEQALLLVELESEIGYLGFIHHFKNYILRKDEHYYTSAMANYDKANQLIDHFKQFTISDANLKAITDIKVTLDEYASNLVIAKKNNNTLSSRKIDSLVKVDDNVALIAISQLLKSIADNTSHSLLVNEALITSKRDLTIAFAIIMLPLFIFGTLYSIWLVSKLIRISTEQALIFNTQPDGIIFADHNGSIIRSNQAANDLFGYKQQEMKNLAIEDLMDNSFRNKHIDLRRNFYKTEQSRFMLGSSSEVKGLKKNGEHVDLNIAISTKEYKNNIYSVAIIRDISKDLELKRLSETDHLTSIYNRRSIEKIIDQEINRCQRNQHILSLMLVDIDRFKHINDKLGHLSGDNAIKKVVNHMQYFIRDYDYIGRWGGDEFLIICPDLTQQDSIHFAQRICKDAINNLTEEEVNITLSIGIATYSISNSQDYQTLIKQADTALYAAKNKGRSRAYHYDNLN